MTDSDASKDQPTDAQVSKNISQLAHMLGH
jgi:hypothetical protein